MIDIKQFFSLNSINEKNRWFQSVASESDFNSIESKDIWGMLDICFTLFKINFENNNYSEYEYIANVCEKLLNLYFKKKV